jgi:microcystin-dependent protein
MAIGQNTALFALLGTYYGGDGKSNFALPNLQAAAPMGTGNGSGLSPRSLGETGGEYTVSLLTTQIAAHNHGVNCISGQGSANSPALAGLGEREGRPGSASALRRRSHQRNHEYRGYRAGGRKPAA